MSDLIHTQYPRLSLVLELFAKSYNIANSGSSVADMSSSHTPFSPVRETVCVLFSFNGDGYALRRTPHQPIKTSALEYAAYAHAIQSVYEPTSTDGQFPKYASQTPVYSVSAISLAHTFVLWDRLLIFYFFHRNHMRNPIIPNMQAPTQQQGMFTQQGPGAPMYSNIQPGNFIGLF